MRVVQVWTLPLRTATAASLDRPDRTSTANTITIPNCVTTIFHHSSGDLAKGWSKFVLLLHHLLHLVKEQEETQMWIQNVSLSMYRCIAASKLSLKPDNHRSPAVFPCLLQNAAQIRGALHLPQS